MFLNPFAVTAFFLSMSIVAWTYLVYPIVVRSLKPHYKPIIRKGDASPSFSIIVPAHNEANVIAQKIENLLSLDYPQDCVEIIVVDDGSTDNTSEIVCRYLDNPHVSLVKLTRVGKTEAINKGLRQARGNFVLVSDADCFLKENALIEAAKDLSDNSVGAVTSGISLINRKTSVIRRATSPRMAKLSEMESMLDSVPTGMGAFLAFRRELVDRLNPRCLADDVDISIQVRTKGFRVIFNPEIMASTWDATSFRSWYNQAVRRTFQGLTTLFKHKSVLFNPKYGWYGAITLPTRLLLHRMTPFFLTIMLVSSYFISPILTLALIILSCVAVMIFHACRKMLVMQFIFLNAWAILIFKKPTTIWERGPRQSKKATQ